MINTFKYALRGIAKAFATQRNMRIHGVVLALVVIAGIYFRLSNLEWIAIILCSGIVLATEIVNTAIEEIVNFISPEKNEKAGLIKDLSAGAVLVAALTAVIVGLIIFLPRIL